MERVYQLTQLPSAVENNLPAGTLILDTTGSVSVFYKYKGILVERDTPDFNSATLRLRIKNALCRGYTLAIKIDSQDDISEFLVPDRLNPDVMNRAKINQQYMDSLSSGRDDFVTLDDDYKFVFVIPGSSIPACLQKYVTQGDLIPITIA